VYAVTLVPSTDLMMQTLTHPASTRCIQLYRSGQVFTMQLLLAADTIPYNNTIMWFIECYLRSVQER